MPATKIQDSQIKEYLLKKKKKERRKFIFICPGPSPETSPKQVLEVWCSSPSSAHVSVHPRVRGSVNVSVCAPWGGASGLACPEEQ